MNIIKSIIVMLILATAAAWLCWLGYLCFFRKAKEQKVRNTLRFMLAFIAVTALFINGWWYIYPFDRTVSLELYAVIDIPEEHTLSEPLEWHAIYEKWGIHSGSKWMDTESVLQPHWRGFDWPDMDFENYTYIISYGQELVSLTYNVWDTVDYPHITGAKAGHPIFSDVFEPNKVYIYEIEKMRIDNDV